MNLDKQVQQFTGEIIANPSPRGIAQAIEANQRYLEYLEAIQFSPTISSGVTVVVDGVTINFKNDDDFESWLAEQIND